MTRRGVTLVELLMAIVIGAIALMALSAPLIAERSSWVIGQNKTEAQRDAQMALRAMARVARQGSDYAIAINALGDITFTTPCGARRFQGGPTFGYQLKLIDGCAGQTFTLIDGVRSQVISFVPTMVTAKKLVTIQLNVSRRSSATDPRIQTESLVTDLFLRNG